MNYNHPTFLYFLDTVTNGILSQIPIKDYFKLSNEKQLGVEYTVFTLMKSSIKNNIKITDTDLISFMTILWKKNEADENYELAGILNNMIKHFEKINSLHQTTKKPIKSNLIKK